MFKRQRIALIAGVDEVGRGPLAGPVVAAAAILLTQRFSARIDDSKRLSRRQRETAFEELTARALWGIGVVSSEAIDASDIGQCTRRAMELAVEDLPVEPEALVVDGLERLALVIPQTSMVRGDQRHRSIAAASIIAKVFRDRLMEQYDDVFPGYEFRRHVGYGTARHLAQLARLGPSPIHRRTFAPVASWIYRATVNGIGDHVGGWHRRASGSAISLSARVSGVGA